MPFKEKKFNLKGKGMLALFCQCPACMNEGNRENYKDPYDYSKCNIVKIWDKVGDYGDLKVNSAQLKNFFRNDPVFALHLLEGTKVQ